MKKLDYNSTENQRIKDEFVSKHVVQRCNELISFLQINEDHDYVEEVMNVSAQPDYENAVLEDLSDKTQDELIEIAIDNDIDVAPFIDFKAVDEILMRNDRFIEDRYDEEKIDAFRELCGELDEYPCFLNEWALLNAVMQDEDFIFSDYCNENNLDPEYVEAYEFYVVDAYLASRLRERGQMVEEIMDFTVWGRCTTGQPILLDHVISVICEEEGLLK